MRVLVCQVPRLAATQADAVEMLVIGVPAALAAVGCEVEEVPVAVHAQGGRDIEVTGGHGP